MRGVAETLTHGYSAYSNGPCRCETCKAAKSAYMRDRRSEAIRNARPGWAADGVTHGTRSAYEEHGCRCGQCLAAERNGTRWNRPRRKAGESA